MQQGQCAADHHGGVGLRRHEDVGGHGGGGGLSVGAGDAHGVLILPHDGAPGLRALIHGDAAGDGAGDLGVVIVDGGGTDHQIAVFQILGVVTDGHRYAGFAQVLHGGALVHVRALYRKAHAGQHLRQRTHGHAADTRQMHALARLHILHNIHSGMHHHTIPPQW